VAYVRVSSRILDRCSSAASNTFPPYPRPVPAASRHAHMDHGVRRKNGTTTITMFAVMTAAARIIGSDSQDRAHVLCQRCFPNHEPLDHHQAPGDIVERVAQGECVVGCHRRNDRVQYTTDIRTVRHYWCVDRVASAPARRGWGGPAHRKRLDVDAALAALLLAREEYLWYSRRIRPSH
jgi:hypothetical protein